MRPEVTALFRELADRSPEERREYLQRLFYMDVRLATFVSTARDLGFAVTCGWDNAAQMPRLAWLH